MILNRISHSTKCLETPIRKLSLKVYIYQILESMAKPYLLKNQEFVLGKDSGNGYGKAKDCDIVR